MIVEGVYVTGPCIAIMGIVDPEGTKARRRSPVLIPFHFLVHLLTTYLLTCLLTHLPAYLLACNPEGSYDVCFAASGEGAEDRVRASIAAANAEASAGPAAACASSSAHAAASSSSPPFFISLSTSQVSKTVRYYIDGA